MAEIPYATEKDSTYENFTARCPLCGFRNIFNRGSDLKETDPIGFREVVCLNDQCKQKFNINGDLVSSAFRMLVFDCYPLKEEKKYSYCILNLAQAHEVFFSLYLRVEFLFRPFSRDLDQDLNELNILSLKLYEKIKTYTYAPLRNIFVNSVLLTRKLSSLDEVLQFINDLEKLAKPPSDVDIANLPDPRLSQLLQMLKQSNINELRNRVVHKNAYRPSLDEVEAAIEETRSILFPLARYLDIDYDDINWYIRGA
jgi:hypothetical protein